MKRIRVASGKFVTISPELAEKAAGVYAICPTREQALQVKASEPKRIKGLMAGSPKPLTVEARSELTRGARAELTHP